MKILTMKLTINTSKIIFGLVILFGILTFPNLTKATTFTFNYTWTGDEIDQPALPTCDATPRAEGGYSVSCDHEDGTEIYKININGTISGCTGEKVTARVDNPEGLTISYGPSSCPLTFPLENPIGEGTVRVTGTGFVVPSGDSEPKCAGGTQTRLVCSPSEGWETTTCPYDASLGLNADYFICPFVSNLQAVFSKELDPQVHVYGDDIIRNINKQTDSMTVLSPTSVGQENTKIYWTTEDVTSCTCTYNGVVGDCGEGISPFPTYAVFASGQSGLSEGEYSLTSDKTFTVDCIDKTN